MFYHKIRVEKIINYAICSYLVCAPKGLGNGLGFQKLNKLNKCFALVTLLPFSKKKMNYCQGSHRIKRPCKQSLSDKFNMIHTYTNHGYISIVITTRIFKEKSKILTSQINLIKTLRGCDKI